MKLSEHRELQQEVDLLLHQTLAMANATAAKHNRKLKAIKADELLQTLDPTELDADIFEPAPEHWKQFLVLPPHLKKVWIDALRQEINTLLKETTFIQEPKPDDQPIIAVTAKMRVKAQANGKLEKAKVRVCLRGDQQEERADESTWCPIAGHRAKRKICANATRNRARLYQLDFIGAFLQSHTQRLTYTMLPKEWAELLPEFAQWCGVPLRLNKALYGDVTANKCWDDELSSWLVDVYGFARCLSEPSIFIKRENGHELVIVNAVDDQLYYSTSDEMRKAFEAAVSKQYNVELMGQAHWYLQARITQSANYDITIDQSRYIALICNRFLPQKGVEGVTDAERKKYAAPLPYDFVATKEDRSKTYVEVLQLQEEYGFEYASVIGMLIYLMNTAFILHFAITKLGKFNALPGEKHFKAVKHILNHLRCNHTSFGITYYADPKRLPLNQLLKDHVGTELDSPLTLFTDSSWQDCPDTGRSTGGYLLYQQGGLIDGGSFVPTPVALSSAEAEYNALAYSMQAVTNQRQTFQELCNNHPDAPLTIPFYCDSESALIIGENLKDTKRTRHIQRRIHYARDNIATGAFKGIKIDGKINPADTGTKNLTSDILAIHFGVMHVTVPP